MLTAVALGRVHSRASQRRIHLRGPIPPPWRPAADRTVGSPRPEFGADEGRGEQDAPRGGASHGRPVVSCWATVAEVGVVPLDASRRLQRRRLPMMLAAGYLLVLRWNCASFYEDIGNPNGAYSTVWLSVPVVMTALYLGGIIGLSKFLESRKPVQGLRDYMFTYNLYQVIINVWSVVAFIVEVRRAGMRMVFNDVDLGPKSFRYAGGEIHAALPARGPGLSVGVRRPLPPPPSRLGFVVWVHYNNKFVELLDTLWMVLRKKTQQVSFLHVYHHVLLIWSWYAVVRFANGGDCFVGALMNSVRRPLATRDPEPYSREPSPRAAHPRAHVLVLHDEPPRLELPLEEVSHPSAARAVLRVPHARDELHGDGVLPHVPVLNQHLGHGDDAHSVHALLQQRIS